MVPTLSAGTFFRRSRVGRYVHSYNDDGTIAATIQERPRDLFDRVFGTLALSEDDTDVRRTRLRRSVLDSVVNQYRFYTGQNSPLGAASRAKVADHLDRIREFEQRAYEMQKKTDNAPPIPPRSTIAHGGPADPGGEGIDITLEELSSEWQLLADLYALAVQPTASASARSRSSPQGERIRLKGDYDYDGRRIFQFDDGKQRNKSGSAGCSHEWWHDFKEKNKNEQLRAHAHMHLNQVAHFLHRLNEADALESNGRTIMENSMITISTESGDGRHADVKRELSGVFHAITGANNRFKTGQIMDVKSEGIDVYKHDARRDGLTAEVGTGKAGREGG